MLLKKSDRIYWLNYAKLFAIILVVLGHSFRDNMLNESTACNLIFKFIYRFHMPLWFFLSGCTYGFNKERYLNGDAKAFVLSKLKTLIVPYAVYSLIMYLAFSIVAFTPLNSILEKSGYAVSGILKYAKMCLAGENPYAFHLWFLELLFIISVFVFLIEKVIKNKSLSNKLIIAVVLAVIIWRLIFDNMPSVEYKWIITAFMRNVPWYVAGMLIIKNIDKFINPKKYFLQIFLTLLSIFFIILRVTVFTKFMPNIKYRILIQAIEYLAVFDLIFFIAYISNILYNKYSDKYSGIGKKSFSIYLLHQPFCAFLGILLYDVFKLPVIIVLIVCIFASIIFTYAIIKLLRILKLNKLSKVLLNIG